MKKSDAPLLMITAGGTGGHIYPAQALIEELLNRNWRVRVLTDVRGVEYFRQLEGQVELSIISSAALNGSNIIKKITALLKLLIGTCVSGFFMLKERPKMIVGFGGYPAFPGMLAATLLKIPILIHEQNGVLGKVNQFFARRASVLACGVWPTKLPNNVNGVDCGIPVREDVLALRNSPYIPPGDYPLSILVLGGSQASKILSEVVPSALALLPVRILKHLRVAHQARDEDQKTVEEFYQKSGINADVKPFFIDVSRRINEAQLIISRAGASTIAEISIIGRPSILVPLKVAVRDEQTKNASSLVQAKAAIIISEDELTSLKLKERIYELIRKPTKASKMAQAAYANSKPDASKKLLELVESLSTNTKEESFSAK